MLPFSLASIGTGVLLGAYGYQQRPLEPREGGTFFVTTTTRDAQWAAYDASGGWYTSAGVGLVMLGAVGIVLALARRR